MHRGRSKPEPLGTPLFSAPLGAGISALLILATPAVGLSQADQSPGSAPPAADPAPAAPAPDAPPAPEPEPTPQPAPEAETSPDLEPAADPESPAQPPAADAADEADDTSKKKKKKKRKKRKKKKETDAQASPGKSTSDSRPPDKPEKSSAKSGEGADAAKAETEPPAIELLSNAEADAERAALDQEAASLRGAGNGRALQQLCDSRRVQKIFLKPEAVQIWQSLCRGWAAQLLSDWSKAQKSYEAALAAIAALPSSLRHAVREYAAQAHFGIGEMYEQRLRAYGLCLTRLGNVDRAQLEASKRAALQTAAERAYREVLHAGSERWSQRALFRIAAMSDLFYREVSGPPVGLRGLRSPPPLASNALNQRPLTLAVLAADQSGLRRSILVNYRKLLQRVQTSDSTSALATEIENAIESLEKYEPHVEEQVQPPWSQRGLDKAGIESIRRIDNGYAVVKTSGEKLKWSTDAAVREMQSLLAPLDQAHWSPVAAIELAELGATNAAPVLVQALSKTEDRELQVAAAFALGRIGDDTAVPPLLDAFRATQAAGGRTLFSTAQQSVFGLEERIIKSLIAIGRRHPLAVEGLMHDTSLPRREAAFVLWGVGSKSLTSRYSQLREDRDTEVAAYGIMASVQLQGESARWLLQKSSGDAPLLACVRSHLLETGP